MADGLMNEIRDKWLRVVAFVEENFEKKPDLNAILFLIGIRELGEPARQTLHQRREGAPDAHRHLQNIELQRIL